MTAQASEAPRCAQVSRLSGETLVATASPARSWLLVETPGSWSRDVVTEVLRRALPPERAAAVLRLHQQHRLRPLAIRRPGRTPPGAPLTVLVGGATPTGGWLERLVIDRLDQLVELDVEALVAGRRGHGQPVEGSVVLVCTHSSKDVCCAMDGRPLAAALAVTYGDMVWECSHVGGDRFAGNLVILPAGEYHGRVDELSALAVTAEAMAGRVRLQHLRGRGTYDPWQQAAEAAVRTRTGQLGRADVLCGPPAADPAATAGTAAMVVEVATLSGSLRARVERRLQSSEPGSRCRGPLTPYAHVVTELTLVNQPGGG